MIKEPVQYEELIKVVSKWSPARKFMLVQDLLQSLRPAVATLETAEQTEPIQTLDQALGLLATAEPAPTDDEVEQMLVDERMEKHGLCVS